MRHSTLGNCDCLTYSEFETLLDIDRKQRLELVTLHNISTVIIEGRHLIPTAELMRLLKLCEIPQPKTPGKPKTWAKDMQTISPEHLKLKFNISRAKLRQWISLRDLRVVNLRATGSTAGLIRVSMSDIKLLLSKQLTAPSETVLGPSH